MKKTFLLLVSLNIATIMQALIISNNTAGNLATAVGTELTTCTTLTVTGNIDASDFKTMRTSMTALTDIDLSGATIVAYTGNGGTNPASTTYLANTLPHSAFKAKSILNSLILPNSITSIDHYALNICSNLTTVNFPTNLILGAYSFSGCSKLTSAELPTSLTTIYNNAFWGCTSLLSIIIPENVTSIQNQTFYGCTGLKSINIPSNITSIGRNVFQNCSSLITISIPASVTSIDYGAFIGCSANVIVDAMNNNYSSEDGVLFNKLKTTLIYCPTSKVGNYTVPSTVDTFVSYAFESCSNLYSIKISKSIPTDFTLGNYVFNNVNKTTCILYVPVGSISAYQGALQWQDFSNIEEYIETKIDKSISRQFSVKQINNELIITNAKQYETLLIYNINGSIIRNQKLTNSSVEVVLPEHGIYIVKVGAQSEKIIYQN